MIKIDLIVSNKLHRSTCIAYFVPARILTIAIVGGWAFVELCRQSFAFVGNAIIIFNQVRENNAMFLFIS